MAGCSIDQRVIALVGAHPSVRRVQLVGSRAEGRATAHSDWDFRIDTDDFPAIADELPALCAPLYPVAQQWDRLSSSFCWMLILPGPTKVDLIFANQPHPQEPPWEPTSNNLAAIDLHFWDWILWLGGKGASGRLDLFASELEKLHHHLLAPLGVSHAPQSVSAAVEAYRDARAEAERRLGVQISRALEHAVGPGLGV